MATFFDKLTDLLREYQGVLINNFLTIIVFAVIIAVLIFGVGGEQLKATMKKYIIHAIGAIILVACIPWLLPAIYDALK